MAEKRANPKPGVWQKGGPSPNPSGRPKQAISLTRILHDKLAEARGDHTRADELAETLLRNAEAGDVDLIRYVFNRVDGMPKQHVEQTGDAIVVVGVAPRPDDEDEE